MFAEDIVKKILDKNKNIIGLEVKEYSISEAIQDRVCLTETENNSIERALLIRETYKIPFWDSLMIEFINGDFYSKKLLSEAARHNKFKSTFDLDVKSIDNIDEFLFKNTDKNLVITSRVKIKNGEYRHIPMLDFHCFPSQKNLSSVKDILKIINIGSGFILDSGKSYHFYGETLLEEDGLFPFLAKTLFFSPIVDRTWVAHQMLEQKCALRLSKKQGIKPILVDKV